MIAGSIRNSLSRGLAIVLLGVAALLVYAVVAAPLVNRYHELQRLIEEQRHVLGRLQASADARPSDTAAGWDALHTGEGVFLEGGSNSMKAAELQARLGRLADAESLAVKSARALEPRETNGVQFIGVEMQFSSTNAQLQKLLLAIESQRPYLFVESIRIAPPPIQSEADRLAAPLLDVDLSVVGAVEKTRG